jgi:hypothetical protein
VDYAIYLLYDAAPSAEAEAAPRALVDAAIEQTRDSSAANAAAATATHALKLVEPLPAAERLLPFCEHVLATANRFPPRAILWTPAQRILSRDQLQQALDDDDATRVAVNVRLFHVEEAPGEWVEDTMGLSPLGLPDVQCHFVNLEPADVAAVLFVVGRYLIEEGGVISEGDTFPGVDEATWTCHLEESLLDPPRDVIDLEPPSPFAARRG